MKLLAQILNGWFRTIFYPYEKADERYAICIKCEKRTRRVCDECGCVIDIKVNTSFLPARYPQ